MSTRRRIWPAVAALLWMGALLWSARATITGRGEATLEVTSTAYALPGVTSAALLAGAAAALAVLALLDRRAFGATARFAVATGAGLAVGLLGALTIITINTEGWVYAVVGGTVAAAATIGGALGGFRPAATVAAACWGTIAVFVLGFLINTSVVRGPLLDLLGAGNTPASQASAANLFSITQSVLGGLAAGIIAHLLLRRATTEAAAAAPAAAPTAPDSAGTPVRWPLHALAGAGPGLVLLVAEVLTRTAGARVLELAGRISELELAVQSMLSNGRFNSALIVLFVGAVTGIIAVGRTLKAAPDDDEPAPATPAPRTRPADPS